MWRSLGIKNVRLEINSLGEPEERKAHRDALVLYFEKNIDILDDEARKRLYSNPLRILDTKNLSMQALVNSAPRLIDFLGNNSKLHFLKVQKILDANGVAWVVNPRLVRGMDYYNLTVFEFITDQLGSQGTICGGGRYDYLMEQVGGKSAPAVGWALGIERVLELLKEQDSPVPVLAPDAYAVVSVADDLPRVMLILRQLRDQGVNVQMHSPGNSFDGMGSIKAQFKKADASGAAYALIFGSDELLRQCVGVKFLRDSSMAQIDRALDSVTEWAATLKSNY